MAASFPAAQKNFAQQTDSVSDADAADVNAIYDEVEAIEGHLGAGSIAAGQVVLTGTAPWLRLYNTTEEDTDGGRESQLQWRGEQSGGEISTLGLIEISHDGTSDDEKGKFFLKLNDGDDANSPTSYLTVDSMGKLTLTTAAETADNPGRQMYLQRTHTGALDESVAGYGLAGVEVRSTFNGAADALNAEVKGGEFKARHTTGNTYDVGTFKGVIGNVDVKNGTVTTGWAVEGAIDVSSGGTFTTAACFHGNLNNSGTVTNSYGVYVHGLSGYTLTRGLYVDYATTGIYLDNCTTDIRLHNGATFVNAADDGGTLTITEDNIVLVGGGWGKIAFGGYTDWGAGATGTDIDGTGYDWVTSTVGHVDSGLLATAIAAAYHAMTVTVSQTTSTSVFGTWTELYFKNSVDLGGSNNYASVWGQMEGGTNVISPDTGMFMTAFYGNVKMGSTLTIATGVAVNGFRAQAEISAVTNNGRLAAFECLKSGGVDWEYGLYLANMTTGIDVGACTTGLLVSGATTDAIKIDADATTGINITSNCTPADGILIAGACADGIEISGACTTAAINISTANLNGIRSVYNVSSQLGQYVQGIKMEHTRSADIQPSTGGWWGIQVVLNAGTGYAALDQPAYVIHGIFKGDATDPSTDCINVARFETQSDGKVEDVLFVSANAGSTVEGDIGRFVAHVAPTRSILALQNGTVGSTPCALYIDIDETMTSGITFDTGAALTNCIRVTAATNTTYFILADAEAGCFPNYASAGNAIANIKVRIAGADGYIKVYDAA